MAALFVLNIYFKDETYQLERDSKATDFPINMGSDLFAIKLHKWSRYDNNYTYHKKEDFDECIYLTKYTDESISKNKIAKAEMQKNQHESFIQHPKFHKYIQENNFLEYKGSNLMWDVLGQDDYINLIRTTSQKQIQIMTDSKFEAVLNKNNI